MSGKGITGALLTYSRDIFYYTGSARPSMLAITPHAYAFFIRDGFSLALEETWLDKEYLYQGSEISKIRRFFSGMVPKKAVLGTELDILSANLYAKLQASFDGFQFVDISPLILEQRLIKDEYEIDCTRRACQILKAGHEQVLRVLTPGMREIDLAAEVEAEIRRHLHEGVYFMRLADFTMSRGPLASGENIASNSGLVRTISGVGLSSAVPIGPSQRVIEAGDHVVIDIPAIYQGYHADQSRTYVIGRASPIVRNLYAALRALCLGVAANCREGASCEGIYMQALGEAKKLGISEYFLSYGPQKADFIGHGIGLELNEPPFLRQGENIILREGFLVTLELPLVQPGIGGLKLEETVLVRKEYGEILTDAPNDLIETG